MVNVWKTFFFSLKILQELTWVFRVKRQICCTHLLTFYGISHAHLAYSYIQVTSNIISVLARRLADCIYIYVCTIRIQIHIQYSNSNMLDALVECCFKRCHFVVWSPHIGHHSHCRHLCLYVLVYNLYGLMHDNEEHIPSTLVKIKLCTIHSRILQMLWYHSRIHTLRLQSMCMDIIWCRLWMWSERAEKFVSRMILTTAWNYRTCFTASSFIMCAEQQNERWNRRICQVQCQKQ